MNLSRSKPKNVQVKVKVKSLSSVQLFETPWTISYQAPLSMEFSKQEYWSEFPFLFLGIFPTQEMNQHFLLGSWFLYY